MPLNLWTEGEIRFLRRNHKKMRIVELAEQLGRSKGSVNGQIHCLHLRKKTKPWTEGELEFLADNLGRMPKAAIARKLKRSENALKIAAYRKLNGLNQRSNIFTARSLAEDLGISCAKIIVAWHDRGYLEGKRASFSYGANQVWFFDYADIIKCLIQRPWLVNPKKMPPSYFRSVVQKEWEKNPWYDKTEAGKFLGLADGNPIFRYIKKGWLPANRRPRGGGLGAWIIRHSDLAEFQLHDPRPAHRKGVTLPETIEKHLKDAEEKAWKSLARYKFQMFGYWAGVWVHLNSLHKREPNPFAQLVQLAREERRSGSPEKGGAAALFTP